MAKSAYSKFDPAKDFGLKSLYCNDATLYDKAKIDTGIAGGDQVTSYSRAHADLISPIKANLPALEKLQQNYPSISKDKYDELLRSKPYEPKHHMRKHGGKDYTNPGSPLGKSTAFLERQTD